MADTKNHKDIVAVIGARVVDPALLEEAEKVGRVLAEHGVIVLTGGLGGVMEAASKGASEAGGLVLGILPGESTAAANPHVSVPVATGMGIARNVIIARTADALIAVGGEYGTLSEIAHALQMKKPVAGIGSWDIDGVVQAKDAGEACSIIFAALAFPEDTGDTG